MRKVMGLMLAAFVTFPAVASTHHRKSSTSANISHKTTSAPRKTSAPGMDPDRAEEIQTALIKQGYLTGEPTRQWDAASINAMQKLQSDNGWQTKYTPDARALNKLGLGSGAPASAE